MPVRVRFSRDKGGEGCPHRAVNTLLFAVAFAFFCAAGGWAASLPLILPTPKHIAATDKAPLRFSARTVLVARTADDMRAAATVQAQVQMLSPTLHLPIVRQERPGQAAIVFHRGKVPHVEGYTLRVGPGGATVIGHDPQGVWYGAQTLCQLLSKDGRGIFVPAVSVNDWPTLGYRGALLFTGQNAEPFHHKLIERVLSRLKFNAVLLECEGAGWSAMGKDAPADAMPLHNLRADIAFARAQGLSVTPLVEGVGHMGWLLRRHPEWAEDPQTPYAVNTANPEAERRLFAVFAEAMQAFHTPALCIGGDEVNLRGRYPFRSRDRYPTVTDAFAAQVTREHDFLQRQGVRTKIWGDMLLAPGEGSDFCHAASLAEAQRLRARLPKDIAVLDWHYSPSSRYNSLDTLRRAGFGPLVGATWNNPANMAGFSHALAAHGERGLLQTIWAGYDQNEANLRHESAQFAALVVAADAAWNGGHVSPFVQTHADTLFWKMYGPRPHS